MNAITTAPVPRCLTDVINTLVTNLSTFQVLLLHHRAIVEPWPALIGTPLRDLLALRERILNCVIKADIHSLFNMKAQRVDVEGGR